MEALGRASYFPFLPFFAFLSFAFLSLATAVSFEQVDGAEGRTSVGHPPPGALWLQRGVDASGRLGSCRRS